MACSILGKPAESLSGLLNGIAQKVYYNNSEITEELLKNELFPEMSQEEFKALHEKMKGLLKVVKGFILVVTFSRSNVSLLAKLHLFSVRCVTDVYNRRY
uniref:COMMD1 N-terminal domain-containing protein n=1 Tax=Monopterus albus TaxID=43700 RepID=A0A3Q3J0X1_MONAL